MNSKKNLNPGLLATLGLFLCLAPAAPLAAAGRVLDFMLPSPSLRGNRLQDAPELEAWLYIPEAYETSTQAWPVLYFLPGFGDSPAIVEDFAGWLDGQVAKKPGFKAPLILSVGGTNALGGSFYANSSVTGNWGDAVCRDCVQYMDSNYRTLAKPAGRALAGFSMGGFGAVNLGLAHPEIFGSIFAASAGLLEDTGLPALLASWDKTYRQAYGAVFAPDLSKKSSPWAGIPAMKATPEDQAIQDKWLDGFGHLRQKIQNHLRLTKNHPSPIKIICGSNDYFAWILKGSRAFDRELQAAGVPHEYKEFNGGHDFGQAQWAKEMFPFVLAQLWKS